MSFICIAGILDISGPGGAELNDGQRDASVMDSREIYGR